MEKLKLENLFEEKDVETISEKVLSSVRDKIKEQIADKMYDELSSYLSEHYDNCSEEIERKLIKKITERYVEEPNDYKYSDLREQLWKENKEELIKLLTDEAIKDSVENIIMKYTHRDYHFNWQWKDGIADVVLKNWNKFKDDKRINDKFGRELDRKQGIIEDLQQQLAEIRELT